MTDRRSVAVTGVLAALFACLVGCGDAGASGTQANTKQVADVPRVIGMGSPIPVDSADGPLHEQLPEVHLDGRILPVTRHLDYSRPIRVSGVRTFEVKIPELLGNVFTREHVEDRASSGTHGGYLPGEVNIINPGTKKSIYWYRHEDPKDTFWTINIESVWPGVYARIPVVTELNGKRTNSYDRLSIDEKPIGNVLYWEEHRTNLNQLVGFDLAFEFFDDALLESLPTFSPHGMLLWHPLTDYSDAQLLVAGLRQNLRDPLLHYELVQAKPGTGIVMKDSRPECAMQISLEEESTVVRLSMRCWPQKLDVDLMCIELDPFGTLNEDDDQVLAQIDVYLPKSPFKAEGFELPEFQEAAQSE